ncbi:hypothetical protein [Microcystis sp.]|uniref:hypothetical protein n=1 Tax=Microcystis sp. TaxID=1127 RepID=UPI00391AEF26
MKVKLPKGEDRVVTFVNSAKLGSGTVTMLKPKLVSVFVPGETHELLSSKATMAALAAVVWAKVTPRATKVAPAAVIDSFLIVVEVFMFGNFPQNK